MNRIKWILFLPALALPALAAPLTGASGVFTLPSQTGPLASAPGIAATTANAGPNHTGTWVSPAPTPWLGTYTSTGPIPASANVCNCVFDFTALNAGYLPQGTNVRLSDLDSNETLELTGYDTGGSVLLSHWLTDLVFVGGGNPADFVQAFMPSWTFNSGTGVYTFTGESAAGNPTLLYILQTSEHLSRIDLNKSQTNNGFSLATGEVPEPGTFALAGLALAALGIGRRRSS